MATPQLTRTHRILIGVVIAGAVVIAGIGFAGSYAAVRELALQKGFGNFSYVFPIGIDAGICVLLALDLLLTWIRIPFPMLRQTAWLLTAATIAFNGAAAWPDPLGVGMHAIIPVLFVVAVEAARHAIGRIADITADKHMEGVRLTRWLLSPVPTFLLWRRMKLWELRSYEEVIKLEQERLVYRTRLRARFGRAWRRKAPVESLMPLRLAKFGVPLADTAAAGLAAAGIKPAVVPAAEVERDARSAAPAMTSAEAAPQLEGPASALQPQPQPGAPQVQQPQPLRQQQPQQQWQQHPQQGHQQAPAGQQGWAGQPQMPADQQIHYGEDGSAWFYDPRLGSYSPATYQPDPATEQWYAQQAPYQGPEQDPQPSPAPPAQPASPEDTGAFPVPVGQPGGRPRRLGEGAQPEGEPDPEQPGTAPAPEINIPAQRQEQQPPSRATVDFEDDGEREDAYYQVFRRAIDGSLPTARQFGEILEAEYGHTLTTAELKDFVDRFAGRYDVELAQDHIA
ncbi:DUF2637 domain-containing protein [Streptomyces fragilis]|uniref:DUF2637 domain-containing protein n=1 Tax=Streptomyces fragilis TaxID=67301 RepID=UPI0024DEF853|nr:DUF2637 domain-containing protein [Streptomyces fragilis]